MIKGHAWHYPILPSNAKLNERKLFFKVVNSVLDMHCDGELTAWGVKEKANNLPEFRLLM